MRVIVATLLIAFLSAVLQLFLPWWSLAIAAFAIALIIQQSGWRAWLSGFLGVALVWWGYAFYMDNNTGSILSEKLAQLFPVGSPLGLILISGLIGGLVGAFAALSGSSFRKIFK